MRNFNLFLLFFFLKILSGAAQTASVCVTKNAPGADNCQDACLQCSLNGYTGQTAGYTPDTGPGFCGDIQNNQWLGFIAGADFISISVLPANCLHNDGIEIALYGSCTEAPIACAAGQAGGGITARSLMADLVPGNTYFLMVDGFAGDACQFFVSTGPSGAVAVPSVDSVGAIQGPTLVAPMSTISYTVPATGGATAYRWTGPSDLKINGQTPPVEFPAPGGTTVTVTFGNQPGTFCVTPLNPCMMGDTVCHDYEIGNGQVLPPCPANDTPAADICQDACVYCNFTGYTGTTDGYTGQTPPGYCGTIENEQWIGFIASGSFATFTAISDNCEHGDGVQIALYAGCNGPLLACNNGQAGGSDIPVAITSELTPGQTYFLMVDGYAGDHCNFQITVTPPSAPMAPPLGATGPISGPAQICPGAQTVYSIAPVNGAGSYIWDAPMGWLINGQIPPVTLSGAGSNEAQVVAGSLGGAVCVQPVNSCNEGQQVCKTILVSPIPVTVLPRVAVCAEDAPYILPCGLGCFSTGTYDCIYPSYLGCDSIVRVQVVIKAPIVRNLPPQSICAGGSVTICGETYTESGSYSAVCESYQGCDSVVNFTILKLEPIAQILPEVEPGCSAPPLVLNSSASPGTKVWKTLDGQVIGMGNTITVNTPGIYILMVTVSSGGQFCTSVDSLTVQFDDSAPDITATGGILTCTQPETQLIGTSSTPGILYQWSGPSGFQSTQESPVVNQPGTYVVVVTNPVSGCTAMATTTVVENKIQPVVSVSGEGVSCKVPVAEISCSTNTLPAGFSWTGPGGFSSSDQNIEAPEAGCYRIEVVNPANGCSTVDSFCVQVDTITPSVLLTGATLNCLMPSAMLEPVTVPASGLEFYWSGPAGLTSSAEFLTVSDSGSYQLLVTNPVNGCSSTISVFVGADKQEPDISVSGGALSCQTPTATLACTLGNGSGQEMFAWTGPGGFTSNEQNPTVTQAGIYTVTVTSPNGCSTIGTATATADNDLPQATIFSSGVLTCTTTSVSLEAVTDIPQAVFEWSGPGGPFPELPAITVSEPGQYTLQLTDPTSGCFAFFSVTVEQDIQAPQVELTGGTLSCASPMFELGLGIPPGIINFQLSGPGLLNGGPKVDQPGTYTLVVTDAQNGCTGTASTTVTADFTPPAVSIYTDPVTCLSDSIFVGVQDTTAGYEYLWSGPNGFMSTAPGFWIAQPDDYTLVATNPLNGCTAMAVTAFVIDLAPPVVQLISVADDVNSQGLGAIDISITAGGSYTIVWYKDSLGGTPVGDTEDLSHLTEGIYLAMVTGSNGCTATLAVPVMNETVSVQSPEGAGNWEVFPNPAANTIWVRYTGTDSRGYGLVLTDALGRTVAKQPLAPVAMQALDVGMLPAGIYLLRIRTSAGELRRLVALQR